MNRKQFKDWMEAQGVKDEDEIQFIYVDNDYDDCITAEKDAAGWTIT